MRAGDGRSCGRAAVPGRGGAEGACWSAEGVAGASRRAARAEWPGRLPRVRVGVVVPGHGCGGRWASAGRGRHLPPARRSGRGPAAVLAAGAARHRPGRARTAVRLPSAPTGPRRRDCPRPAARWRHRHRPCRARPAARLASAPNGPRGRDRPRPGHPVASAAVSGGPAGRRCAPPRGWPGCPRASPPRSRGGAPVGPKGRSPWGRDGKGRRGREPWAHRPVPGPTGLWLLGHRPWAQPPGPKGPASSRTPGGDPPQAAAARGVVVGRGSALCIGRPVPRSARIAAAARWAECRAPWRVLVSRWSPHT